MDEIQARAARYGVRMAESLSTDEIAALRESVDHSVMVAWTDPELVKILRLRLIGYSRRDYPWWDVSYCYGQLRDGTRCLVRLPFNRLDHPWQKAIIRYAQKDGVYLKRMGVFDGDTVSQLWG